MEKPLFGIATRIDVQLLFSKHYMLTFDHLKFLQYDYKGLPKSRFRVRRHNFYCHRSYANLTVFGNGDVVSCENYFDASLPLENVRDQSLYQILSSAWPKSFFKTFRYSLNQFSFYNTYDFRDIKHQTANVKTNILN